MNARRTAPGPCRAPIPARGGFTLVELLVVIVVIMILSGMAWGALYAARETAKESRTKAIIAKLDHVIMSKYQSYLTRRVSINTAGMEPKVAARARLDAIRDLMRMEMPERWNDITEPPVAFAWGSIPTPALNYVYGQIYQAAKGGAGADADKIGRNSHAECLFMIVNYGIPEARQHFNEDEIADTDGDGLPEFVDAWGTPIYFLRWAPAFSSGQGVAGSSFHGLSDIQPGDPVRDHDPFDVRKLADETGSFKLVPLIYSAGRDKKYDIQTGQDVKFAKEIRPSIDAPYANVGEPIDDNGDGLNHWDNIHNHHIESR